MTELDQQIATVNGIIYEYLIENNYKLTAEEFIKETKNKINMNLESKNLINILPALLDIYKARNEQNKNINLVNKIEMVLMAQENTKRKLERDQLDVNINSDPIIKKIKKRFKNNNPVYYAHNNKTENIPQEYYNNINSNHSQEDNIEYYHQTNSNNDIQNDNYANIFNEYPSNNEEYHINNNSGYKNSIFSNTLRSNELNSTNDISFNLVNTDTYHKSLINDNYIANELIKSEQVIKLIQKYKFQSIKITSINASQVHEVFIIGQDTGNVILVFLKDMNPIDLSNLREVIGSIIDIQIVDLQDSLLVAIITSEFEIIIYNINCKTLKIQIICDLTLNNQIVTFSFNSEFIYIAYEDREIQKIDFKGQIIKTSILNNMIKKIIIHKDNILVISDSVQVILYDFEREIILSELTTKPVDLLKKDCEFYIITIDDLASIYDSKLELQNMVHIGIEYTTVSTTGGDNVFVAFNKEVYWHGSTMKCLNTQSDTIYSLISFKIENQICLITGSFSGEVNVYFALYE